MDTMVEVLEEELAGAFEVKDKKSLHRYVLLLTENIVKKENYEKQQLEIKSDIRTLAELVKQGFEHMDKRFEAIDKRFEAIDKRFEYLIHYMDKRFESLQIQMDKRFEAVDKRFEDLIHYIDKRFEDINKRFTMMFTFMNIGLGILIAITVLFKFIG